MRGGRLALLSGGHEALAGRPCGLNIRTAPGIPGSSVGRKNPLPGPNSGGCRYQPGRTSGPLYLSLTVTVTSIRSVVNSA